MCRDHDVISLSAFIDSPCSDACARIMTDLVEEFISMCGVGGREQELLSYLQIAGRNLIQHQSYQWQQCHGAGAFFAMCVAVHVFVCLTWLECLCD